MTSRSWKEHIDPMLHRKLVPNRAVSLEKDDVFAAKIRDAHQARLPWAIATSGNLTSIHHQNAPVYFLRDRLLFLTRFF